jgi:hypothetical protein
MRIVVWFSCGVASAVAAKLAIEKYSTDALIVYCDTSADEHSDNKRFLTDVSKWLGTPITIIKSPKYSSIKEVFDHHKYMSGVSGARCTIEMKKIPRFRFQQADDINIFGLTADESKRIVRFENNNPELKLDWILKANNISKSGCFQILQKANIEIPVLYTLGFKNNNCIGCVKASSPKYWDMVRRYFPDIFADRAEQSRKIGCKLIRLNGRRAFLDELPVANFEQLPLENISCGPECGQVG